MEERRGTRHLEMRRAQPELKALVVEASQALARLDTARLEELALSCQALSRDLQLEPIDTPARKEMARQAREASADMAVFARVLEAARTNLNVMNRLCEMRLGQLEYKVRHGAESWARPRTEAGDGNH